MLPKKLVDFFAHQSGIQDIAVAEREVVDGGSKQRRGAAEKSSAGLVKFS